MVEPSPRPARRSGTMDGAWKTPEDGEPATVSDHRNVHSGGMEDPAVGTDRHPAGRRPEDARPRVEPKTDRGGASSGEVRRSRTRFRLRLQGTRAACYLIALLVGVVFKELGVIHARYDSIALLLGIALLSAAACWLLAHVRAAEMLGRAFDAAWMLVDVALITWAVHLTGGVASPWFPWYLAIIAAGAFVGGQLTAFAVATACTGAYLGVLAWRGDIQGLDLSLYEPLARMAFLYGASFLFLRGISQLQERQRTIKRIRADEARKIEELTRLTRALDQRTRQLADANLRIREADRLKSQFLATMSHELRTPLNSIIGFSDVLMDRLAEQVPDRYQRFLENINSSGQHLLGIINDLLDLSKIEAGRMELVAEPVCLADQVRGVCTVAQGLAKDRHIVFDLDLSDDLPLVEVDPGKLKQVLFNLLSNAVKFSHEGGTVRIRARQRDESDCVEIAVQDFGLGIAKQHHRLIFEEFRQLDAGPTRAFGGTGLGLALVRRLVELHHGRVMVDSAPGRGSTFTISLPRRFTGRGTVCTPPGGTLQLPEEEEDGLRILVVEDDPTAFESIRRALRASGYIPVRARTCDEALHLAEALQPAAITLDIILPGPDGWEILRALKEQPRTRHIPVVIVSVLDTRELALALGAADCFVKPVDGDALARRLTELLPRQASRRPRLLLIDDDPALHELLADRLDPLGYDVRHATDGPSGLQAAGTDAPDLVLLDLMMEAMDGFEVAARLRSDPSTTAIPVVVLTAKDVTARDRERLRGKMEALVQKSASPLSDLPGVIDHVLRRQRKEGASV